MAVVIQQPDALAPVNSAAEGFTASRDKAMALALAKEKQSADIRQKDRSLDLQQQKTESDIVAQKSQTAIAEAQEAYRKRVEPILEAEAQAHLQGAQSEVRLNALKEQVAKIDAEFAQQLHAAGLDMKQAQAKLQETQTSIQHNVAMTLQTKQLTANAKAEEPGVLAQQKATIGSTEAATASSRASAAYSGALAANVGKTPPGVEANYTGALEAYTTLSPQGRQIVDAVESGKMTERAGALAAQKLGKEAPKIISAFSNLQNDPAAKRDPNAVTPQQRATAVRGAISSLGSQGIKMPSDPHFGAVLKAFMDPGQKASVLADPSMPQATKSYLQQIDALVP